MLTVKEGLVREEKILSSRFIGVLRPLLGVEFKTALEETKALYPKASHYCYAYRKGASEGSSDDGEPSHSAGLPLLNVLRGSGLDECGLFVVRYFGGIKLGLGRLTHAYSDLAKLLVKEAVAFEARPGKKAVCRVPYSSYERLALMAKKAGLEVLKARFEGEVILPLVGDATILSAFLAGCPEARIEEESDCFIYREAQP